MALNDKTRKHNDMDFQKDLSEILTNAKIGLWAIEMDEGKEPRMYFDDVAREITGFYEDMTPEECYERWYKRIVDSAIDSVQASVKEMIEQGKSENTYAWIHPKKGRIYTRCGGSLDENYTAGTRLWGYHQDVTENMQAAEIALQEAKRANAAKTTFLSRMSHDIRTPMNAIIGFTTLAVSNIDNQKRVRDYLGKILSSSNHLLSLINDILDMSRIESGKIHLEETEVSLSDVLHDLKTIIGGQIHAKQLELYMDAMDVTNEDVYCDKTRLNQVLLNLLSNAVKFTPAGGTVSVRLKQFPGKTKDSGLYEIRVKDSGIGMSPEFVQKIFSPFERERTSTVSRTQGTGLGMAITKNIVDMMGGTIEVQTEQGKGTEFVVRLALKLQPEHRRTEKIAELEGLKALVVDDDFNTCDSVTKMLVKVGMRSEWTLSGKEAVLRARQSMELGDAFHAYIIDWRLPDMNGMV